MLSHVRILTTVQQLQEVKALDDLAFEVEKNYPGIVTVSLEEIENIAKNGTVLGIYDGGQLIAESLILTSPIPTHKKLSPYEAFSYSTAIHPDFRGRGLAAIIYQAQEKVAKQAGKKIIRLTVRVENPASIRARFKMGYSITGYDSAFYGPLKKGGARLFMSKIIGKPAPFYTNRVAGSVAVPITPGYTVDLSAHQTIRKLMSSGYTGIGLLKSTVYNNFLIIFSKQHAKL